MVHANSSESIKNSLRAMQKIFAGLEDYRVLGSVLVAALNGKPHRELHDVDMLVDEKIYDEVTKRFREQGFSQLVSTHGVLHGRNLKSRGTSRLGCF